VPAISSARGEPPPDPAALEELDLEAHLTDPTIKQRWVTAAFDIVAPRYDRFTRWFSFGMDAGWKRDLVSRLANRRGAFRVAVDLACGTGDLALAVSSRVPAARIVGLDVSRRMLHLAAARALDDRGTGSGDSPRIAWCVGDLCRLPFPDRSVDLVTAGYAIRNASSWTGALDESARALSPGGVVLGLDFFQPPNRLGRRLFLAYLAWSGRFYGWAWHRSPVVYGYIARSIAHFTTVAELASALEARGLEVETVDRRLGGGIALFVARRPALP